MALNVTLSLKVEALGATWYFGAADKAVARISKAVSAFRREHPAMAMDAIDEADLPVELVDALCDYFCQGIRAWEGVETDGMAVPFTHDAVREMPFAVKLAVAQAALVAYYEMLQKKGSGAEPPITSTPPEPGAVE